MNIPAVNTSCGETRNGGVRLTGGASDLEGRVEVCLDGVWGTICNNFWNNLDAAVVCHQLNLGRTDSRAVLGSNYGAGSGPIFFDNVFCRGTEILITNCQRGFTTDCSHTNDAGVVCSGERKPCNFNWNAHTQDQTNIVSIGTCLIVQHMFQQSITIASTCV